MAESPLYLDYNATAPLAPGVREVLAPFLGADFHNPSSLSQPAQKVRGAVHEARLAVARLMGAQGPDRITFTSGATESIHAAFHAAACARPDGALVIGAAEHSASKGAAQFWAALGRRIVTVPVDADGRIEVPTLQRILAENGPIALVSLIYANNETGALQPLEGLADCIHGAGALWHLDTVQAPGKVPLACAAWQVDYASISGHKFGAPKGSGALYHAPGAPVPHWQTGGGQEQGRRGGTENVAAIAGLGAAARLAAERVQDPGNAARLAAARDTFETELLHRVPQACVHAGGVPRVGNTSFVGLPGTPAEYLLPLLEQEGVLVSAGSACDASHHAPSPVLLAMGVPEDLASSSLRLSFGPEHGPDEGRRAAEGVAQAWTWMAPPQAAPTGNTVQP
ncbi:MAG: aminotransferase class V-fold PLP-dependent enzyme [Planctomycetota bacterium]